jgi:hypothetical protein
MRNILALAIAAAVLMPAAILAEDTTTFDRGRKWDFYLLAQGMNGKQFDFNTQSGLVPLSMDSMAMGGFGIGYIINSTFETRLESTFGNTVFRGKGIASGVNREASVNQWTFNFDWLPLRKRVTPFLTAGFGWQYLTAQVSNQPPSTTVYYDPWWGYTATASYPVHQESDFLGTAGFGFLWNISSAAYLRASLNYNWIRYQNTSGVADQARFAVSVGTTY